MAPELLEHGAAIAAQAGGTDDLAQLLRAFNDVTARLQETQQTLRAEVQRLQGELEQANAQLSRTRELAALGEMAAGIAHEIRNPLGSIKLYSEALEEDVKDRPGPAGLAVKIGSAVRGLDRIVGDVLAFARETRLSPAPCDPAALLMSAVDDARAELLDAGADVQIDADDDLEFVCDAELMRRALVNLVRNAAEAVREAGGARAVRLTAGRGTRLGVDGSREACAVVAVEDSGPGIPEDVIPRMFNPFFTTRAVGTGLGLAIVHRIVDAHGGSVEVTRAEPLGGARVAVQVPIGTAEGQIEHSAPDGGALPERRS